MKRNSDEKNNNIIQFPKFKSMRVLQNSRLSRFDLEQRKVALTASIASILFVMTFANSNLFSKNENQIQSGRMPAAVSTDRNTEWEHKLAKRLSGLQVRDVASIGKKPSIEDKLRFEELQGKYAIRFQNDNRVLSEIEFTTLDPNKKMRPKVLGDSKQFLMTYKSLMPQFESLEPSSDYTNDSPVYTLVDNGRNVAKVKFDLDRYGRLLKLKVIPTEL